MFDVDLFNIHFILNFFITDKYTDMGQVIYKMGPSISLKLRNKIWLRDQT